MPNNVLSVIFLSKWKYLQSLILYYSYPSHILIFYSQCPPIICTVPIYSIVNIPSGYVCGFWSLPYWFHAPVQIIHSFSYLLASVFISRDFWIWGWIGWWVGSHTTFRYFSTSTMELIKKINIPFRVTSILSIVISDCVLTTSCCPHSINLGGLRMVFLLDFGWPYMVLVTFIFTVVLYPGLWVRLCWYLEF